MECASGRLGTPPEVAERTGKQPEASRYLEDDIGQLQLHAFPAGRGIPRQKRPGKIQQADQVLLPKRGSVSSSGVFDGQSEHLPCRSKRIPSSSTEYKMEGPSSIDPSHRHSSRSGWETSPQTGADRTRQRRGPDQLRGKRQRQYLRTASHRDQPSKRVLRVQV